MKKFLKRDEGSFLIEGLLAIALMLLLATFTLPIFMTATSISAKNKLRTIAASTAGKEIEKVKSLYYDNVGLINGNPSGVIEPNKAINVGNVQLNIKTRVRWVDDPLDGLGGLDTDVRDYKKLTITITWLFAEKADSYNISTNITRESREQIALGGGIEVFVKDTENNPVEDVKVEILSGPSGAKQDWTDENGRVLFVMLPASIAEGDYSLTVSKNGYLARPDLILQTTTVVNSQKRTLEFIVGQPGSLNIRLVDSARILIEKSSKVTLRNPDSGESVYNNNVNGLFNISNLFPGYWDVVPSANSYDYNGDPITALIKPGLNTSIEIVMTPRPQTGLHLTVTDSFDGVPISNANVILTNVTTSEGFSTQTNSQGTVDMSVEVGTYDITVEKAGYITKTNRYNLPASIITNVNIALDRAPLYGSILVRTLRSSDGTPRSGVRILVTGSQYNQELQSNVNGDALFINLIPGDYFVYRWSTGWRFPNSATVLAGQQTTVEYRY